MRAKLGVLNSLCKSVTTIAAHLSLRWDKLIRIYRKIDLAIMR